MGKLLLVEDDNMIRKMVPKVDRINRIINDILRV